jgi:hypothetical protein
MLIHIKRLPAAHLYRLAAPDSNRLDKPYKPASLVGTLHAIPGSPGYHIQCSRSAGTLLADAAAQAAGPPEACARRRRFFWGQ